MRALTRLRLLWAWLRPVVSDTATEFLRLALPVAANVISNYALSKISNNEKREGAMRDIRTELERTGVAVPTSLLELAFSLAFRRLREGGSL